MLCVADRHCGCSLSSRVVLHTAGCAGSIADIIENFRDMIQNVDSFSWIVDWPGGRSPTKDGRGGRLLVRKFQAAGEAEPAKHPRERWYEADV